jgi:hypothetical protein
MNTSRFKTDNPLTFGLSFMAAIGLILMILVLAYGVVMGSAADDAPLGLLFVAGLVLLISGIVGWTAVVRPHAHFDDINIPLDTGHGHGHEPHAAENAHADEHPALPASTEKAH